MKSTSRVRKDERSSSEKSDTRAQHTMSVKPIANSQQSKSIDKDITRPPLVTKQGKVKGKVSTKTENSTKEQTLLTDPLPPTHQNTSVKEILKKSCEKAQNTSDEKCASSRTSKPRDKPQSVSQLLMKQNGSSVQDENNNEQFKQSQETSDSCNSNTDSDKIAQGKQSSSTSIDSSNCKEKLSTEADVKEISMRGNTTNDSPCRQSQTTNEFAADTKKKIPSTQRKKSPSQQSKPNKCRAKPSQQSTEKKPSSKKSSFSSGHSMKKMSSRTSAEQHSKQTDIRQHFPVRLSRRISETAKKEQQIREIKAMIQSQQDQPDLEVIDVEGKGKGVVAGRDFQKGDYICEYAGDLITREEAENRERKYLADAERHQLDEMMCYMYYLRHQGKVWCVDATNSKRIGRLVNHSRTQFNLRTKLFEFDNKPHLGLVASRDIVKGEELLYDYGERDPNTLKAMPWLKQ